MIGYPGVVYDLLAEVYFLLYLKKIILEKMSVNDSSPSNDNENIYCSDFDIIK